MKVRIGLALTVGFVSLVNVQVIALDRLVPSQYPTIQAAIDASDNGDEVIIAPGIYTGTGNRDIDFVGKAITVRSSDPNDPNVVAATVIDCQGSPNEPHRGFTFHSNEDANSVLAGLLITGGHVWDPNGRLLEGGGILVGGHTSPIISRCTITCCVSFMGGGISSHGPATIIACDIVGNGAGMGGGIVADDCRLIANCNVAGNTSELLGGGIISFGGTATSVVIANCTVVRNTSYQEAGGIATYGGILTGCTISGNLAGHDCGGVGCVGNPGFPNSPATLTNCIIWGNQAPTGREVGIYYLTSFNISGAADISHCAIQGGPNSIRVDPNCTLNWGPGNIDVDPLFVDPNGLDGDPNTWQDNDYHLSPNSPCINTGDPNGDYSGQTDMDGEPRVAGGMVDIGSDEVSFHTLMLSVVHDSWGAVDIDPNRPAYPKGTTVVLSAEPIQGKAFEGWAVWGDSTKYPDPNFITFKDANSVLYLTMNGSCLVEATFKCGSGMGVVLPLGVVGLLAMVVVVKRRR